MGKILLLSEVFPPQTGGSGRWFWEIYRRIDRPVVVAAHAYPGCDAFDRTHELDVVRSDMSFSDLGVFSLRGWQTYCSRARRLGDLSLSRNATTTHAGRILPEGWLALALHRRFGTPFLSYVHGEELPMFETSRQLKWMARRVIGRASALVANSDNTAALLRERWGVPEGKVRVLHPGADASRYRPVAVNDEIRRRLGWSDRPVILTVGRLQRRKGHDVLISALPKIVAAHPDVLYAIVGDGDEMERLRRMVEEIGVARHVIFHGEVDDDSLLDAFQQCDVFTLPNRTEQGDIEGFGIVLVEAQACGKPVVAGASGGTRETMRVGESGLIVPCETPEPLAEVLSSLLSDASRRKSMGEAGRAWVMENLDWDALAMQAERIFEQMEQRIPASTISEAES